MNDCFVAVAEKSSIESFKTDIKNILSKDRQLWRCVRKITYLSTSPSKCQGKTFKNIYYEIIKCEFSSRVVECLLKYINNKHLRDEKCLMTTNKIETLKFFNELKPAPICSHSAHQPDTTEELFCLIHNRYSKMEICVNRLNRVACLTNKKEYLSFVPKALKQFTSRCRFN